MRDVRMIIVCSRYEKGQEEGNALRSKGTQLSIRTRRRFSDIFRQNDVRKCCSAEVTCPSGSLRCDKVTEKLRRLHYLGFDGARATFDPIRDEICDRICFSMKTLRNMRSRMK